MIYFLVIGRIWVFFFGFRKEFLEIFFFFGRYRSGIINLLILEDLDDFFNVLFLGLMEFIGIGRSFVK